MTLPTIAPQGHPSAQARWTSSSKRNPCPVCNRISDSKCRRRDDALHCFRGSRFGPPENLRRGDVLQIEGRDWFVAELAGGFSGNHLILRPHRPMVPPGPRRQPATPEQVQRQIERLRDAFARARTATRLSLGLPALETCTLEELEQNRTLLAATLRHLQWLQGSLREHRRLDPSMAVMATAASCWARQVAWQSEDLEAFTRRQLGVQEVAS